MDDDSPHVVAISTRAFSVVGQGTRKISGSLSPPAKDKPLSFARELVSRVLPCERSQRPPSPAWELFSVSAPAGSVRRTLRLGSSRFPASTAFCADDLDYESPLTWLTLRLTLNLPLSLPPCIPHSHDRLSPTHSFS